MFIQHVKHGYILPFRSIPNLARTPLIQSGYEALQNDQALATCIQSLLSKNAIERVDNVKSLWFYSCLFLVPKPHQRWRPVIDLSRHFSSHRRYSHRKVQNGNSRVHQDFPSSREMGIVDRSVGRLPSHPHPPKLKEIPKVLPQVSDVPVHLSSCPGERFTFDFAKISRTDFTF